MTIKTFAGNHRLKTKLDECGETVIPGKQGHVYEYDDTSLGVVFMPPKTVADRWGKWKPKTWGNFRRAAVAIDMIIRQEGDSEGCLSFDPGRKEHVKLALKIGGIRAKRKMSDEQKARLVSTLAKFRKISPVDAPVGS